MQDLSERLEVKVLRTTEEMEEIRSVWESWQWFPGADIDMFLRHPKVKGEIISPFVILLLSDCEPLSLLIGRLDDTDIKFQVGYKTIFQVKVRLLRITHGGILGNNSNVISEEIINVLLQSLKQDVADLIIFDHLPVESEIHSLVKKRPGFLQCDYFAQPRLHWLIDLPDSYDDFLIKLSKNTRRNIRRYNRMFQNKYGERATVKKFDSEEDLDQMMLDAEKIASQTYQRGLGTGFIDDPVMRRRMGLAARNKWLRGYILYIDGIPSSFEIGLQYGGTFFALYTGYEPNKKGDRPGTILLSKVIEDLCEDEGIKLFDFGFGNARYKMEFGNRYWQESIVHIFAPTLMGLKLNLAYSFSSILSQAAIRISTKMKLYDKLKTHWRSYLASSTKSPSN